MLTDWNLMNIYKYKCQKCRYYSESHTSSYKQLFFLYAYHDYNLILKVVIHKIISSISYHIWNGWEHNQHTRINFSGL